MATQTITTGTTTFGAAAAGDSFYVLKGHQPITGNLDYSGQNTSVLAEISREFTGSIGSSSASWKTAFSSRLVYSGAGDLWWESDSLDTETTALAWVLGGGHLHATGDGILTRLEAISGQVTVSDGVTVTTGRFGGTSNVYLLDTGTGPTVVTLDVTGGSTYCQRPCTTINARKGHLTIDQDSAGGVNAIGTLNVVGAHVAIFDSGTITTLTWDSGMIDGSKITRPLTITNSNINMSLPGAVAFTEHPLITFTNATTELYSDGRPL